MIVALDLFLDTLRKSRLLPEETVAAEIARFKTAKPGRADAKAFAEALCRKRLLTVWQAQNLLAGKHRGYFVGSYTLQGMIGKGGMSFVYLAEHRMLKRRCAIKVLPAAKALNPGLLSRFQREARAAASLDHPNIVRMLDGGEIPDGSSSVHYLVMEYVEGTTLFDLVRQSGPLTVARAVEVIRQAARGLQHVHDSGLVHRDIKPENLIVDRKGVVKLMDLGLARFLESDEEQLTIQQEGRVLGTANYCAPEQAIDSHRVDSRADVYSLGCTLYFLLAGRPPFHEGSLAQRLLAHQNRHPAEISSLRSDVPRSLSVLMSRMMAKSPTDRIATAGQVAEELERIASQLDQAPAKTRDQSEQGGSNVSAPDEARSKRQSSVAAPPTVITASPGSRGSQALRGPVDFVHSSPHATRVSAKMPANPAAHPAPETLSELRDAIGKVSSVERAVAMLKADTGDLIRRPAARLKPGELKTRRDQQRVRQARKMVGGLVIAMAVLVSTLSTWASPGGGNSRPRTIATIETSPPSSLADRRNEETLRPAKGKKPRAVVAQAEVGARAG